MKTFIIRLISTPLYVIAFAWMVAYCVILWIPDFYFRWLLVGNVNIDMYFDHTLIGFNLLKKLNNRLINVRNS